MLNYKFNIKSLPEIEGKIYNIISVSTKDSLDLSLNEIFIGKYYQSFSRILILTPSKDMTFLNFGQTLLDRKKNMEKINDTILGDAKLKECKDKRYCCRKDSSCKVNGIGEFIVNYILEKRICGINTKINGISRFDKSNNLEGGIEYQIYNCSSLLNLKAIWMNDKIFTNREEYINYIREYKKGLGIITKLSTLLYRHTDFEKVKIDLIESEKIIKKISASWPLEIIY